MPDHEYICSRDLTFIKQTKKIEQKNNSNTVSIRRIFKIQPPL